MKTTKKALLLTVCALVLVASTVFGTMAYMTAEKKVTNTFTAGILVDDDAFKLEEHKYTRNEKTGLYEQQDNMVNANDYVVVPGVNLPKDPAVTVKVDENAYLFLEVVNNLPAGMTFEMDGTKWTALLDESEQPVVKGENKIYVPVQGTLKPADGKVVLNIIKDQEVTVTESFVPSTLANGKTLEFNAYLCQATSSKYTDALGAWNALFAK